MDQDPVPPLNDAAFDEAMRRLSEQATTADTPEPDPSPTQGEPQPTRTATPAPPDHLQRLLVNLAEGLGRVESALASQAQRLDDLRSIRAALEQRNTIETANQRLFDSLHNELKSYKDSFLFELLQKPVIKDLISLHDDLDQLNRQANSPEVPQDLVAKNAENALLYLLEILERLGVTRSENSTGTFDRRRHRIVHTEPAETPAEEGQILRTLRPGFVWRDTQIRPEDVAVRRTKTGRAEDPA